MTHGRTRRGPPCRPPARPARASGRIATLLAIALGALAVGALTVWAFLAYTHPDRVLDFAALLQMCGIPVGR